MIDEHRELIARLFPDLELRALEPQVKAPVAPAGVQPPKEAPGVQAQKPKKPHPDFPLFAHKSGRWCKKVRGKFCYFGKVADDPKGEAALNKWLNERDDLLAGRTPRVTRKWPFLTIPGAVKSYDARLGPVGRAVGVDLPIELRCLRLSAPCLTGRSQGGTIAVWSFPHRPAIRSMGFRAPCSMPLLVRQVGPDDAEAILGILNPIIESGAYSALDTPFTQCANRRCGQALPS